MSVTDPDAPPHLYNIKIRIALSLWQATVRAGKMGATALTFDFLPFGPFPASSAAKQRPHLAIIRPKIPAQGEGQKGRE